jgi:hypothetical protein
MWWQHTHTWTLTRLGVHAFMRRAFMCRAFMRRARVRAPSCAHAGKVSLEMYKEAQGIEAYVYEDKIEDADAGVLAVFVRVMFRSALAVPGVPSRRCVRGCCPCSALKWAACSKRRPRLPQPTPHHTQPRPACP